MDPTSCPDKVLLTYLADGRKHNTVELIAHIQRDRPDTFSKKTLNATITTLYNQKQIFRESDTKGSLIQLVPQVSRTTEQLQQRRRQLVAELERVEMLLQRQLS